VTDNPRGKTGGETKPKKEHKAATGEKKETKKADKKS